MTFTQTQNGSAITGSTAGGVGTLTLTMPGASTAGTLLVACMVASEAGVPFKITAVGPAGDPNTSPGWEWCATGVNGSGSGGQQVEIWCYRKNPGGITNTTWTIQSGQGLRGHMMEFTTSLVYQVMELFPGLGSSVAPGDTSFPVAMGNPVSSGDLAIAMFGDNFSTGTLITWTAPGGWTAGRTTGGSTIANHWASYYQTTSGAGSVSVTGTASTATNQLGWEAALVVFREASSIRSRVGGSCAAGTYNDQASYGFKGTQTGSSKEADFFVGRPMFQMCQVSYQHEGDHLTTGPTADMVELTNMGAQICWAMRPRRTGLSSFVSVADEQAAVDQDLTLVKQAGITGFICTSFNEHNYGGVHGPFGDDSTKHGADPYGNVTNPNVAKQNWLTYWANYQPVYAAHGIPIYTKPSYASPASCSSWHPPAGTVSGVVADFYYQDSAGKTAYLDQSPGNDPGTGLPAPALTAVCDGTKNADNSAASNTPIPLGIGEWGRAGLTASSTWAQVVSWSHTGGSTGHVRDLFTARLAANKMNAPIIWFENDLHGPNWLHVPGTGGEDETGILAELAACVDALAPQAAGTTVVVDTAALPDAQLGAAYNQALQVHGGTSPYTWATLTGSLPTGLSLSAAGVISGTPTVAGTYNFTVKATDAGSNIGNSGPLSIFVPSLSVTTTTLPAASIGVAYGPVTLTQSGGTGPFTWAVTAGALPSGITLSSGGVLSGTTGASPGAYGFSVTVTDSLSAVSPAAALTLTVSAGSTGGGTPAPPQAGYPQLIVEAGFYASSPVAQDGALILDDPVFAVFDTGILGDATAWTDITTFARSATVTRASTRVQGPLRTYQAGTVSVALDNSAGAFDPLNLAGPFVTGGVSSIRPMVPVRVRAVYGGVTYYLFSGFADSWTETAVDYDAGWSEVTVSATDGFKILAGITLPSSGKTGDGERGAGRISRLLNVAQWYTDHRDLDTGDSQLQGTVLGDTALNLLQLTADTEIGELYIDGAGNVVFRHRLALMEDTRSTVPQGVFGDAPGTSHAEGTELACAAVGRADDDTTLANDVQITRVNGTLQEARDASSIATYLFPRSYARTDVLLESDAEAKLYAQWVLYVSLQGENRFDTLTVDPIADTVNLFPQVLGREIGDRIQVYRRPQNSATTISRACYIRGIAHTVDVTAGTWSTTWDLQDASRYTGFLILNDPALGKVSSGNKLAY